MSVKRYSPVLRTDTARGKGYQFAEMELDEVGQWVSIADYGVIKDENERIRIYWKATGEGITKYITKTFALEDENARLKAEVERLRKAGDAMAQLLDQMDVVMDMNSDHPEVEAWLAAKEGKPTE